MSEKPYIIVRHKPTGRAFSMNRGYYVLEPDLGIIEPPTEYVEDWDGWLTIQAPRWVYDIGVVDEIHKFFHAYWMY